jgi:hypothetical protein
VESTLSLMLFATNVSGTYLVPSGCENPVA